MGLDQLKTQLQHNNQTKGRILGNRGNVLLRVTGFHISRNNEKCVSGIPVNFPKDKQREIFVRLSTAQELTDNQMYKRQYGNYEKAELSELAKQTLASNEKVVLKRDSDVHLHTFNDPNHNNYVGVGGYILLEDSLERLGDRSQTYLTSRWASFIATHNQIETKKKRLLINVPSQVTGSNDPDKPTRYFNIAHQNLSAAVTSIDEMRASLIEVFNNNMKACIRISDDKMVEGIVVDNLMRGADGRPFRGDNGLTQRKGSIAAADEIIQNQGNHFAEAMQIENIKVEVMPLENIFVGRKTTEIAAKTNKKLQLNHWILNDNTKVLGNILGAYEKNGYRNSVVVINTEINPTTEEEYDFITMVEPLGSGRVPRPLANLPSIVFNPFEDITALRSQNPKKSNSNNQAASNTEQKSQTRTGISQAGNGAQAQQSNIGSNQHSHLQGDTNNNGNVAASPSNGQTHQHQFTTNNQNSRPATGQSGGSTSSSFNQGEARGPVTNTAQDTKTDEQKIAEIAEVLAQNVGEDGTFDLDSLPSA